MGHLGVWERVCTSVVSVCISVSIVFSGYPSHARLGFDYTQLTDIDPTEQLVSNQPLTPDEEREIQDILKLPTQITLEILFLLKNLYFKMIEAENKRSPDEIIRMLKKRKDSENIEFEIEHVGKAEPIVVDVGVGKKPVIITKVRHNALKMSLLFIDKSQIDLNALDDFDRHDRAGMLNIYEPLLNLNPKQRQIEIEYQRLLVKKLRTLWAKMLMSEWNPQFEYSPLVNLDNEQKGAKESVPDEVADDVNTVLEAPLGEIQKKNWFKTKLNKAYDTWVDMAEQDRLASEKLDGNHSLVTVMFDSQRQTLPEVRTLNRAQKHTLTYWRDYWRAIWEPPAYDRELWQNSKGLAKLRVLATGDYSMGLGFGVALGGLSYLIATLFPGSLPAGLDAADVGMISSGWSVFFAVVTKTWQNFTYRGGEFVRFLKNWSTGIGQSYHFNLISHDTLSVINSQGQYDSNAIKSHSDILINQSIKSTSKTSLQEKYRYRAKRGEAEGTVKIPYFKIKAPWEANAFMEFEAVQNNFDLMKYARKTVELFSVEPLKERNWEKYLRFTIPDLKIKVPWVENGYEWDTKIPKSSFEGQKPQLITTPIGLLSRFGYTVYGLPLGHILYALLGPFGEIQQTRYKAAYAEEIRNVYGDHHAYTKRVQEEARQARERWDSFGTSLYVRKLNADPREDYYEFKIPGSSFIGYYVNVVPKIFETAKSIGSWAARKAARLTYSLYQKVKRSPKEMQKTEEFDFVSSACVQLF